MRDEAYRKVFIFCETCREKTNHVLEGDITVCLECNLTTEEHNEVI
jgi:hypothetical protein